MSPFLNIPNYSATCSRFTEKSRSSFISHSCLSMDCLRVLLPIMDSLLQQTFDVSRPLLLFVKLVNILKFTQQKHQSDLMIQEVAHEVCARTVNNGNHYLKCASEAAHKFLKRALAPLEQKCKIDSLCNPHPF